MSLFQFCSGKSGSATCALDRDGNVQLYVGMVCPGEWCRHVDSDVMKVVGLVSQRSPPIWGSLLVG